MQLTANLHSYHWYKAGGNNTLLVRPAYSYGIVLIVFVLKALINLYVRSDYQSGYGLTCLGGSPSHVVPQLLSCRLHNQGCNSMNEITIIRNSCTNTGHPCLLQKVSVCFNRIIKQYINNNIFTLIGVMWNKVARANDHDDMIPDQLEVTIIIY